MREAQSAVRACPDPGPRTRGRASSLFPSKHGGVGEVGVTCCRSGKISGLESKEGRKRGCVWGYVQAETRDTVPLTLVEATGDRQKWGGIWVTTGRFTEKSVS